MNEWKTASVAISDGEQVVATISISFNPTAVAGGAAEAVLKSIEVAQLAMSVLRVSK